MIVDPYLTSFSIIALNKVSTKPGAAHPLGLHREVLDCGEVSSGHGPHGLEEPSVVLSQKGAGRGCVQELPELLRRREGEIPVEVPQVVFAGSVELAQH